LLGVTATPNRSDKQELGKTFDKITFSRSIGTMIKGGYLSPIVGRKILTSFILKKMHVNNGDFSLDELAEAVNTPERNQFIAEKYKAYANDRKGVAFCVDVQHCKDIAETLKCQGIEAKAVFGDMASDDRKRVLEDFKKGRIQVVTSCGVLCEGFDEPSIDVVLMARPTKSQSLYIQCVGRGLRLWPGKVNCLVLDFTDRNNNLDGIMSLNSVISEAFIVGEVKQNIDREEVDRSSKIEVLEECDQEFDILGCARFLWVSIGDDEWSLLDDEKREIIMRPLNGGYVSTLCYPDGTSRQIVSSPLSLEYCSGVCEDFARRNLKITFADLSAPWMKVIEPPTKGQRDYLQKQGLYREGLSKNEASFEIRKIISLKNKQRRNVASEPITNKQKYSLLHYGIDPKNMNKFEAMVAISRIKQERLSCG
jgi:ATP-dependent helicase IRC3